MTKLPTPAPRPALSPNAVTIATVTTTVAIAVLATAATLLPARALAADDYPSRPVTLIVPYPAGGNADIAIRVLAESLEKSLGASIVVSPTPGAGGITGTQKVLSSKPDGYTLFVGAQSTVTVPTQTRKLRFSWDTPEYIATIAAPSTYIGVDAKNEKIRTFDELVSHAKQNPGAMNAAIIGRGGLYEVIVLQLSKQLGLSMKTLPFNGGPPTVAAVLGGHADFLITDNYNAALRPLVMTGVASPHYPGVKSLTELGHAGLNIGVTYVVAAPQGTPMPVLKKVERAFGDAIKAPKYQEVLTSLKWAPLWRDMAETRKVVADEASAVKSLIDAKLLATEE